MALQNFGPEEIKQQPIMPIKIEPNFFVKFPDDLKGEVLEIKEEEEEEV